MPFIDPQNAPVSGPVGQLPQKAAEGPPDDAGPEFWGDVMPAAFRTENTVGSALAMGDDVPLMYRRDAVDVGFVSSHWTEVRQGKDGSPILVVRDPSVVTSDGKQNVMILELKKNAVDGLLQPQNGGADEKRLLT